MKLYSTTALLVGTLYCLVPWNSNGSVQAIPMADHRREMALSTADKSVLSEERSSTLETQKKSSTHESPSTGEPSTAAASHSFSRQMPDQNVASRNFASFLFGSPRVLEAATSIANDREGGSDPDRRLPDYFTLDPETHLPIPVFSSRDSPIATAPLTPADVQSQLDNMHDFAFLEADDNIATETLKLQSTASPQVVTTSEPAIIPATPTTAVGAKNDLNSNSSLSSADVTVTLSSVDLTATLATVSKGNNTKISSRNASISNSRMASTALNATGPVSNNSVANHTTTTNSPTYFRADRHRNNISKNQKAFDNRVHYGIYRGFGTPVSQTNISKTRNAFGNGAHYGIYQGFGIPEYRTSSADQPRDDRWLPSSNSSQELNYIPSFRRRQTHMRPINNQGSPQLNSPDNSYGGNFGSPGQQSESGSQDTQYFHNFQQTPYNYNNQLNGLNSANNFNGLDRVNGGTNGYSNFQNGLNSGTHALGSGTYGLGSGTHGINSGTPGLNSRVNSLNSGSHGVNSGPYGLGNSLNGIGSGSYGLGSSLNGIGSGSYGHGSSLNGIGSNSYGLGSSLNGVGRGSYGLSSGTFGANGGLNGLNSNTLNNGMNSINNGMNSINNGMNSINNGIDRDNRANGPTYDFNNGLNGINSASPVLGGTSSIYDINSDTNVLNGFGSNSPSAITNGFIGINGLTGINGSPGISGQNINYFNRVNSLNPTLNGPNSVMYTPYDNFPESNLGFGAPANFPPILFNSPATSIGGSFLPNPAAAFQQPQFPNFYNIRPPVGIPAMAVYSHFPSTFHGPSFLSSGFLNYPSAYRPRMPYSPPPVYLGQNAFGPSTTLPVYKYQQNQPSLLGSFDLRGSTGRHSQFSGQGNYSQQGFTNEMASLNGFEEEQDDSQFGLGGPSFNDYPQNSYQPLAPIMAAPLFVVPIVGAAANNQPRRNRPQLQKPLPSVTSTGRIPKTSMPSTDGIPDRELRQFANNLQNKPFTPDADEYDEEDFSPNINSKREELANHIQQIKHPRQPHIISRMEYEDHEEFRDREPLMTGDPSYTLQNKTKANINNSQQMVTVKKESATLIVSALRSKNTLTNNATAEDRMSVDHEQEQETGHLPHSEKHSSRPLVVAYFYPKINRIQTSTSSTPGPTHVLKSNNKKIVLQAPSQDHKTITVHGILLNDPHLRSYFKIDTKLKQPNTKPVVGEKFPTETTKTATTKSKSTKSSAKDKTNRSCIDLFGNINRRCKMGDSSAKKPNSHNANSKTKKTKLKIDSTLDFDVIKGGIFRDGTDVVIDYDGEIKQHHHHPIVALQPQASPSPQHLIPPPNTIPLGSLNPLILAYLFSNQKPPALSLGITQSSVIHHADGGRGFFKPLQSIDNTRWSAQEYHPPFLYDRNHFHKNSHHNVSPHHHPGIHEQKL